MIGPLLITLVLLIVSAPIVYVVGKLSTKAAGWLAFIFSFLALAIFSVTVVPAVLGKGYPPEEY